MIRTIAILLILLAAQSCTPARVLNEFTRPSLREPTKKEVRRTNRAARKLDRLTAKYPELLRTDTILTKITTRTPAISGTIIQPLLVPSDARIITLPGAPVFIPSAPMQPFKIPFSDPTIDALFSYDGSNFALDYTIHPIPVATTVATPCPTIAAKEFLPMPLLWWQKMLMYFGAACIIYILLRILLSQLRLP